MEVSLRLSRVNSFDSSGVLYFNNLLKRNGVLHAASNCKHFSHRIILNHVKPATWKAVAFTQQQFQQKIGKISRNSTKEWRLHDTPIQDRNSELSEDSELEECMLVNGKDVKVSNGEEAIDAHFAQAVKNSNGAGVLLLSDVKGYQSEETRGFAHRLACIGYSVLLPDLFRGVPWESGVFDDYESWRSLHTVESVAVDIQAAVDYLIAFLDTNAMPPGNGHIAVLGFCFGGGRMMEVLAADKDRRQFTTGVFFYGTRFEPKLGSSISVPVLLITGDSDPLCTVETVEQVKSQIPGSQSIVFPGMKHAFAHRPNSVEEDDASELAFEATRKWLHKYLLDHEQ